MCTSIVEIIAAEGEAKRGEDWFRLTHAVVAYDHARHAVLDDVITLDFVNHGLDPGHRAAVELTLETAKSLQAALERAIAAAEIEESERHRPDRPAPSHAKPVVAGEPARRLEPVA